MNEYLKLQRKLNRTRRRIAKQQYRVAKQQVACDAFVLAGKPVPKLWEHNLVNMQRRMYDLQGFEQYLKMAIARQEQNL